MWAYLVPVTKPLLLSFVNNEMKACLFISKVSIFNLVGRG